MASPSIAGPFISVEEYLSTSYHPDCEYDEGVLEERNLGEFEHSFLQINLGTIFTTHIAEWGVFGLTEQRVQIKPRRYVVPDVAVLRMGTPRERILTRPPLIAIEIVSPEDRMKDVAAKAAEYLAFGVEHNWIIDPYNRAAFYGTASGLEQAAVAELTVAGTPIVVRCEELFAKLDQF
jgi:Uma2 family endonuclease